MNIEMLQHRQRRRIVCGFLGCLVVVLSVQLSAAGQADNLSGIRLEDEVVPAPDGYDAVDLKYTATKATDIYISPFVWAGKVRGARFGAGEPVPVLAKPKGYDWFLVGRNGAGFGYVPISALTPVPR